MGGWGGGGGERLLRICFAKYALLLTDTILFKWYDKIKIIIYICILCYYVL